MESDNYGIRETTFIQAGRRHRDVESWSRLVLHPRILDKNLRGISLERGVQGPHQAPQPRVPVLEDKSFNYWEQTSGN